MHFQSIESALKLFGTNSWKKGWKKVDFHVSLHHRGAIKNAAESTTGPHHQQILSAATKSKENGEGATGGAGAEDFVTAGELKARKTQDLHSDRNEYEEEE
jgi:hypothetical protein